jgi:carboxypeptidase Q
LLVSLLAGCMGRAPAARSTPGVVALQPAIARAVALAPAPALPSAAQPSVAATPAPPSSVALTYAATAKRIREASLASDGAWQKLSYLTDRIGARLSGSAALERALSWAQATLVADGHERVSLEPVRVPHWVRGAQSAALLRPIARPLEVLALGGSVATKASGVTAEVMVVGSFDELEARKAEVNGKIVLFNHPMSTQGNAGMSYGAALPYRTSGASRAAAFGAVGVLVRSLTARSLGVAHTGSMRYTDPKGRKIPAAAISVEDAELLQRLAKRGDQPEVRLALATQTLGDADSGNVIAELRGRELPDELVLLGAHLDSWDVGQGAQDDGAGVVTMMQALTTLRALGLVPRRTLRVVLFTNEENGVRGATQYATDHAAELTQHVAALEMDAGAGAPLGFMTEGEQPYLAEAREIGGLLAPLGASSVSAGFSGEDVQKLKPAGVPLFGVLLDIEHYFDVHHSAADTLDKIDPLNLQKAVAAVATFAFVLADRRDSIAGRVRVAPGALER